MRNQQCKRENVLRESVLQGNREGENIVEENGTLVVCFGEVRELQKMLQL